VSRRTPVAAWHEARRFEQATREDLRERRWLRLHALLCGALTLALCWAVSASLRHWGVESMVWRPLAALLLTYPLYLAVLALWARWLISQDDSSLGDVDPGDLVDAAGEAAGALARGTGRLAGAPLRSGGGGDFAGGGASASFDAPDGALADFGDAAGGVVGKALSGAADALGDADEGAVVVVPLAVVAAVALALAAALGFAVFGLFGVDVLLGVAVELAFASVGGALAWRARREGWLAHALRRTALPVLGLALSVAAAGWMMQVWLPSAHTWPQALRLLFG
jgi:hypothetical protein